MSEEDAWDSNVGVEEEEAQDGRGVLGEEEEARGGMAQGKAFPVNCKWLLE